MRLSPAQGAKDTARLEAFSDGVFAIAITLLILEIRVPDHSTVPLAQSLLQIWPSYAGYAVSFLTILIMWINHHRIFRYIVRTDDWLLAANGLLLLLISFVPFPTKVLAEHLLDAEARTAAIFYSGTFVVTALIYNLLWLCISYKGRLCDMSAHGGEIRAITRQFALGPATYLLCFLLAFVAPLASVALNFAIAVFFLIPGNKLSLGPKGS